MSDLWQPLWLSLRIAVAAALLAAVFIVPLAYLLARHALPGRSLIEAVLTVPLVLPPTVVGYLLIVTLGVQGWPGAWLHRTFGYTVLFRTEGAVLAAAVVAAPLLYLPSKAAFGAIDRNLEETARLMGAGSLQIFWHVSLPLARRGIGAGMLLAFARALGEFGATMMVFGWQPSRLTLPISVYVDCYDENFAHAAAAVALLTTISLLLIIAYNRWGSGPD